jgi:hypothetical protein
MMGQEQPGAVSDARIAEAKYGAMQLRRRRCASDFMETACLWQTSYSGSPSSPINPR